METEKNMNSEKCESVEVSVEVENDGKTAASQLKSEKDKTESTFNVEEYSALKEKVEKLEGLLAKCRGTIVNNKEKVKRLSEDKEGIQHKFERQLELIKKQYEEEMNSKFSSLQQQIHSLSDAKDKLQGELNDMINLKGEDLITKLRSNHEKELAESAEKVKVLSEELSAMKIKASCNNTQQQHATTAIPAATSTTSIPSTTDTSTTTTTATAPTTATTDTCVRVDPEEHKGVLKMLEARSEELIGVMEERTSLRKELVSQRERFSLVLERYDSQMKVVQEELRLRMMPGPLEASMSEQVALIMEGASVPGGEKEAVEGGEKVVEKAVSDKAKAAKTGVISVEKGLEEVEGKVRKLLVLLQKCARKVDDKEAECARWNSRFSELSEKHLKMSAEAQESIKRLEKQVSEMTIKENDLNEELEKTRTENGDMLRAQRSEMGVLQEVVDRLVANEEFLKTQIADIKSQCDGEVARANEENEKAMNILKGMFEENKKAVSELYEQLTLSKEKSNEVVKEFEGELDYRYRQLEAARTYINCLNEGKTPPKEPSLEAIFSNLPNFIYVDDVTNGDGKPVGDAEKVDGELKENGDDKKMEKEVEGSEKLKNESEKSKKSHTKPDKVTKK